MAGQKGAEGRTAAMNLRADPQVTRERRGTLVKTGLNWMVGNPCALKGWGGPRRRSLLKLEDSVQRPGVNVPGGHEAGAGASTRPWGSRLELLLPSAEGAWSGLSVSTRGGGLGSAAHSSGSNAQGGVGLARQRS